VPVYTYLRANYVGTPVPVDEVMIGAFAIVALICALTTWIPLRVGLKRMEGFEF
jgi:hypothetical protein